MQLMTQLKFWIAIAGICLLGFSFWLMLVAVVVHSTACFWIGLGLTAFTLYGILRLVPNTLER